MENIPIFIQLSFSTSDFCQSGFLIVVEVIDEEIHKVNLVPVQEWLAAKELINY